MKKVTNQEKLFQWLNRPTFSTIEKEAGLQQGYLTKCKSGERNMRPATLAKVLAVVKKHGYKS